MVVKKDGTREPFVREKVLAGVMKACEKRPIPMPKIEALVNSIEKYVQESRERERSTEKLGEMIMRRLKELDKVAYVRFASVYLDFKDVSEFMSELRSLVRKGSSGKIVVSYIQDGKMVHAEIDKSIARGGGPSEKGLEVSKVIRSATVLRRESPSSGGLN